MTPSAKKLEQALVDGTYEVWTAEPDATSVNKVRKHVEEKLELEEGFFASAGWKHRSKSVIKDQVNKLLDGWVPSPKQEPEAKRSIKRQSSELESPEPKRRKRAAKAKDSLKEEDASDLDEEDQKPAKSKISKKKSVEADEDKAKLESIPPLANQKRKTEDDDEDGKDIKPTTEREDEDEDAAGKTKEEDDDKKDAIKDVDDSDGDKPSVKDEDTKEPIDEEEEYSDVIDEPPQRKSKKGKKKDTSSKPSKSSKAAAAAAKKPTEPDDPQEAEIKKLQTQLAKCGIRKLWHIELKKYGDDARGKIRHLKKQLAEIGMEGRFSEAKAREIKETRELMAEAEAAQEMNRLWGSGTGRRSQRSKQQNLKDEASEGSGDEEEANDDDDDDEDNTFAARRRRAQADLAFLGDESDSD